MIRLAANIATAFTALPPAPPPTIFDDYLNFDLLNRLSLESGQNVRYIGEADWCRCFGLQERGLVFRRRIGERYAARLTDLGRQFLTTSRFESDGAS